jgi:hypothetical protein
MPVPDKLATDAAIPVNEKVGLPDAPAPSETVKPDPDVDKVRPVTEPPTLAIMPLEDVSRLPETPFKVTKSVD